MRILVVFLFCAASLLAHGMPVDIPETELFENGAETSKPGLGMDDEFISTGRLSFRLPTKKTAKLCEAQVKGAAANHLKGRCRAYLRFCDIFKRIASRHKRGSFLHRYLMASANRRCALAAKAHKKMMKYVKKTDKKCIDSRPCRLKMFRRMLSAARQRRAAAHAKCMKKPKCKAHFMVWLKKRNAAIRKLAQHTAVRHSRGHFSSKVEAVEAKLKHVKAEETDFIETNMFNF